MSIYVLDRKIHEVRLWVDRNSMRMRHVKLSELPKISTALLKNRNGPGFRRHVESPQLWIEGQNIRILTYLVD